VAPDDAEALSRAAGGSLARARRLAGMDAPALARAAVRAARDEVPRVGAAAEALLGALEQTVAERAAAAEEEAGDAKRARVRDALADLVHMLAVEAKDAAAGRDAPILGELAEDRAFALLEDLGEIGAAVPAHVTPSVVALEILRRLRRALGP